MGVTGQLSFWDASAYQQGRLGDPVDWFAFWVFDGAATRAEVESQLARRMPAIEVIRRRIAELPGHLDRPYWVVDDSPLEAHLVHHDGESLDWSDCMDRIGELFTVHLDEREISWRLHVYYNVRKSPHVDGPATVIVAHLSHTMATGLALEPLTRALFGDGTPLEIVGLPEARKKPLSIFDALATSALAPLRALPLGVRMVTSAPPHPPTPAELPGVTKPDIAGASSRIPMAGGRTVRFVQVPTAHVRGKGVTVTAGVLAAMSRAMQDYAESVTGGRSTQITSNVVIAVPDAELMGVNRLGYTVLNLRGDLESIVERANAIGAALRAARENSSHPARQQRDALQATVPFLVYRVASTLGRFRRRAITNYLFDPRLYTALTSLAVDSAGTALAGHPLRVVSVYQGGSMGITHSLCGSKDFVTVCVVAQTGVADIDAYAAKLSEAATALGAELT